MLSTLVAAVGILIVAVYSYGIAQIPVLAIGDPLGPRVFPMLLAGAMLLTTCLLLLEGRKTRDWRAGAEALSVVVRTDFKVVIPAALWLGLYFVAFEPLGYLLATAIFLTGLMIASHRGRRWVAVVTAFGFSIVSYAFFSGVFSVPLPRGIMPI